MLTETDLNTMIAHATGTEGYTKYPGGLKLTDGVVQLAQGGDCFWLLDIIWSYQPKCRKDSMLQDMQFWKLNVNGSEAVVTCERDTDDVAIRQKIPFTDFPIQGETKLYVVNDVVMLPSEY